jgi:glycosyltransferase involved in cell wall biosynthesis
MSEPPITVNVTAIMTARSRVRETLDSLTRIQNCSPRPDEILVHVDGGNHELAHHLQEAFPDVTILVSEESIGPGGARNRLLRAAHHELVASFDDDSYPLDADFFTTILAEHERHPNAAMFFTKVIDRFQPMGPSFTAIRRTAAFAGCGCIYRRSAFLATSGYVPLPLAYGMEEVDLAMQLHAIGRVILQSPDLRVYHDTSMQHRYAGEVDAAVAANAALLVFLRYPVILWPLGIIQVARIILDLLKQKRYAGIWKGITNIPRHCIRHRAYRKPLSVSATLSYLALRRRCARENVAP